MLASCAHAAAPSLLAPWQQGQSAQQCMPMPGGVCRRRGKACREVKSLLVEHAIAGHVYIPVARGWKGLHPVLIAELVPALHRSIVLQPQQAGGLALYWSAYARAQLRQAWDRWRAKEARASVPAPSSWEREAARRQTRAAAGCASSAVRWPPTRKHIRGGNAQKSAHLVIKRQRDNQRRGNNQQCEQKAELR